jgi:hypothetical protein
MVAATEGFIPTVFANITETETEVARVLQSGAMFQGGGHKKPG